MQKSIEREITVRANLEKVYDAITNPSQIIKWFPDEVQGSLSVGEQPIFVFGEQNHKARIYVEKATPHTYFAYRWIPGGAAGLVDDVLQSPNTLVEFHLEALPEGTKITLKESGFADLPAEMAEASFSDNSGGWTYMLGRLEKEMNQG